MWWIQKLWLRLRTLFRRERTAEELDDEIRFHLEQQIAENVATGMSPDDARRRALRAFGNLTALKEQTRDAWGWVWLEQIGMDFRCGLRTLRHAPGFTAAAVLTLAMGIGANTAIFSLISAVLFRALPYRDPGRLVWMTNSVPRQGQDFVFQNVYAAWRNQNHVFEAIAAYLPPAQYTLMAERIRAARVTTTFLDVLGVTPQLGRNFLPQEGRSGGPKAVLLSDAIWRARFSAGPEVVGRVIALDGNPYTVVGVLPRDFEFLDRRPVDLLIPFQFTDNAMQTANGRVILRIEAMQVVARLRPGARKSAVVAELNQINGIVMRSLPANGKPLLADARVQVISLHDLDVGDVRPALFLLFGTVGFLLLITCVNVANMQLARAVSREKEVAIRATLGAGRWRLARLLLAESTTVALTGGATGLLLAAWTIRLIQHFAPGNIASLQTARLDGHALLFTLVVSLLTGILFGFAPVLAAFQISLNETLKQGAPQGGTTIGARRAQRALVVAEIALSLVLFIGAGLLVKSFRQLTTIPLGFDPNGVLTARVALPRDQYQSLDQQRAFFEQLVAKLQAVPGVNSAGATAWIPLRGVTMFSMIGIEGQPQPDFSWVNVPTASVNSVTPGYFAALRVPLIEGRLLNERDGVDAPNYVVVNQAFVHRYFSGKEDPIGKSFAGDVGARTEGPQTATIVGVIGDTRELGLASNPIPEVTVSALQWPRLVMTLVVRTSTDPASLVSAVRTQVRNLDRNLPIYDVHTMDDVLSEEIVSQRFNAGAMAGFAGLAVLLAVLGIYGVMVYAISQRTREMGVRIALGAEPGTMLRMVLRQGLGLALIGVGLGLAASIALKPLMRGLLFGIKSSDPGTYILGTAALLAAAAVACYIPAQRATRVDPVVALRCE